VAIGFPAGITTSNVTSNAQARLMQLRYALEACENFYEWISNYAASDLEAAPVSLDSVSAQALLNAFADAHELYVLYGGGGLGSYTLPYNFSASQSVIIGPQG
jgi:hypothetical protein